MNKFFFGEDKGCAEQHDNNLEEQTPWNYKH